MNGYECVCWIDGYPRIDRHQSECIWYNEGKYAALTPCDQCGSSHRWLHKRTCGHYYGGISLESALVAEAKP